MYTSSMKFSHTSFRAVRFFQNAKVILRPTILCCSGHKCSQCAVL